MYWLDGLFDPTIRVAHGDPRSNWPLALPQEEPTIRNAVEKRRREFRAGRALAREAMMALGVPASAIPSAEDRSPIWPEGIVGSISHCDDLCVAAVGKIADGVIAIGVDVEPAEPLDADLIEQVCTPEEQGWLGSLDEERRGLFARLIFSAKECAYKCQFTFTRQMLDFDAVQVSVDLGRGAFSAKAGDLVLFGNFRIDNGHIVTAIVERHSVQTG